MKPRDKDRFSRLESRHVARSVVSASAQEVRRSTALPVVMLEGMVESGAAAADDGARVNARALRDADVMERKRLRREGERVREEERVARLGFRDVARFVDVTGRKQLEETYNALTRNAATSESEALVAALSTPEAIAEMERIGSTVLQAPEQNLYLLEVLLRLLDDARRATDACTDFDVLVSDLGRFYLFMVTLVGNVLSHILPGYLIANDKDLDKQTTERMSRLRKHELLMVYAYRRWLRNHFVACITHKQLFGRAHEHRTLFEKEVCKLIVKLTDHALTFNYRDEFLTAVVEFHFRHTHPELLELFHRVLKEDLTLIVASKVVPLIADKVLRMRQDDNRASVLRLLDHIEIERKEAFALNEMKRKNIDVASIKKNRNTETERKAASEKIAGLVSGDYKKFLEHKKVILEAVMIMYSRVLKSPNLYSAEVIFECMRSLSKHAKYVNLELASELFDELRSFIEHLAKSNNSAHQGALAFAAIMAALELIEISSKSADVYIHGDVQWITSALVEATNVLPPFLSLTSTKSVYDTGAEHEDAAKDEQALVERRTAYGKEYYNGKSVSQEFLEHGGQRMGQISLQEFEDVIQHVIASKRAFGFYGVDLGQLARCPKATELYTNLYALSLTAGVPAVRATCKRLMAALLKRFPSIKHAHDQDGIVFDPLSPPRTTAWLQHLEQCTLGPF